MRPRVHRSTSRDDVRHCPDSDHEVRVLGNQAGDQVEGTRDSHCDFHDGNARFGDGFRGKLRVFGRCRPHRWDDADLLDPLPHSVPSHRVNPEENQHWGQLRSPARESARLGHRIQLLEDGHEIGATTREFLSQSLTYHLPLHRRHCPPATENNVIRKTLKTGAAGYPASDREFPSFSTACEQILPDC